MKALCKGDNILLDFDGVIAEDKFPSVGKLNEGVKEFFEKCNIKEIKIIIWSARFSPPNRHEAFSAGSTCVGQINLIKEFLVKEECYFNDFYTHEKPWSEASWDAKTVIDDNVIEFTNFKYLIERLFNGKWEKKAIEIYEKTKELHFFQVVHEISFKSSFENNESVKWEYITMRIFEIRAKDK